MKVVSVIPMKLNNERLPGKNTKEFDDGTPLCNFIFDTVSNIEDIDESYCFCSNEDIISYLPDKIEFLRRSPELDTPNTSINDVLRSFIEKVDADIYVLTHATSPFIRGETIRKCIEAVVSGKYDSALSVNDVSDFFWSGTTAMNFDPSNIGRTQDLQKIVRETSGVYVFTKRLFTESNRRVGFNPCFYKIGSIESIDIDYQEDFIIANAIYTARAHGLDSKD